MVGRRILQVGILVSIGAVAAGAASLPAPPEAELTVMIYGAGEDHDRSKAPPDPCAPIVNELKEPRPPHFPTENAVGRFLQRITQARYGEEIQFRAQFDRGPAAAPTAIPGLEGTGSFRLALAPGPWSQSHWVPVDRLGKIDSGAASTLRGFLDWASRDAPAKRYALVMIGHGTGILGAHDARAISPWTPQPIPGECLRRGPDARSVPGGVALGATSDIGSDAVLGFREFAETLRGWRGGPSGNGRPLEFLGFMACLAGSLEALTELVGEAEYVAASGASIAMRTSWEMPVFHHLSGTRDYGGRGLAENWVKDFGRGAEVTVATKTYVGDVSAAWEMARIPGLVKAVGELAQVLIQVHLQMKQAGLGSILTGLMPPYTYDSRRGYVDLEQLLRMFAGSEYQKAGEHFRVAPNIPDGAKVPPVARAALVALEEARVAIAGAGEVKDSEYWQPEQPGVTADVRDVGGLSIFWPQRTRFDAGPRIDVYTRTLRFPQVSHWGRLLRELLPGWARVRPAPFTPFGKPGLPGLPGGDLPGDLPPVRTTPLGGGAGTIDA